ncbi:MAG: BatA domain-containing protein [Myxococcota bacterium]|nr:BatA domain-containing protein [Myxococcota bacterium]
MEFLSPALLFGLVAVAIPPLLHLLSQRTPKPLLFPAIELLRRAQRRHARRTKLRQWLLISLRSLLLGALALAMSRPLLRGERTGALSAALNGEAATVIVVDQSYAMSYRLGDEQLFERARREARRLLEELRGPVALVLAAPEPRAPLSAVGDDRATLRQALTEAEVVKGPGALADALTLSYRLLEEVPPERSRQVIVISSPAALAAELPASADPKLRLLRVDVSEGEPLPNYSVSGLELAPAPQLGIGRWQLTVEISHWGDAEVSKLPIAVHIEDQVKVRGLIDLPAWGKVKKSFYLQHEGTEELKGELRLKSDALPLDDRRSFWLEPQRRLRVLALNGDPRPTPREDELFYLERTLAPEVTGGPWFELDQLPSEGESLDAESLADRDVIILANLPRVSDALADQLSDFVKAGGGLWLTMGSRVNVDQWNQSLSSLLPQRLRGQRRAGDASARLERRRAATPTVFKGDHPIFSPFTAPNQSTLRQAQIREYMLVEPSLNGESQHLITLDEGAPLLIERIVGDGRVLLLTGSLDQSWGDLPLRPDFLPFAHSTLRHLSREVLRPPTRGEWGRPITLPLLTGERCVVHSPSGRQRPGEAGRLFTETRELGHYRLLNEEKESRGRFVVNLPAEGARLIAKEQSTSTSTPTAELQQGGGGQSTQELWHGGLAALFLLFLFEGFTALRILESQRRRRVES